MHTLDTIQYSATPLSLSPGDSLFLPVEKHSMLPRLCPGITFFAAIRQMQLQMQMQIEKFIVFSALCFCFSFCLLLL